jgi:hypothetical protein
LHVSHAPIVLGRADLALGHASSKGLADHGPSSSTGFASDGHSSEFFAVTPVVKFGDDSFFAEIGQDFSSQNFAAALLARDHATLIPADHTSSPTLPHTLDGGPAPAGPAPSTAPDPELWMTATQGSNEELIIHADDTGTGVASNIGTLFTPVSANDPATASFLDGLNLLDLDTQDSVYVLGSTGSGLDSEIVIGSLSTVLANPTATPTYTTLYTGTHYLTGLALDPDDSEIYFTTSNVFEKIGYGGGSPTLLGTDTHTDSDGNQTYLDGLALDLPHHIAYFTSSNTFSTSTTHGQPVSTASGNSIYETSNLTPSSSSVTISKLVDVPDSDGIVASGAGESGITVDTTTGLIYFTTQHITEYNGVSYVTSNAGVYVENPTGSTIDGRARASPRSGRKAPAAAARPASWEVSSSTTRPENITFPSSMPVPRAEPSMSVC